MAHQLPSGDNGAPKLGLLATSLSRGGLRNVLAEPNAGVHEHLNKSVHKGTARITKKDRATITYLSGIALLLLVVSPPLVP